MHCKLKDGMLPESPEDLPFSLGCYRLQPCTAFVSESKPFPIYLTYSSTPDKYLTVSLYNAERDQTSVQL